MFPLFFTPSQLPNSASFKSCENLWVRMHPFLIISVIRSIEKKFNFFSYYSTLKHKQKFYNVYNTWFNRKYVIMHYVKNVRDYNEES